MENLAYTHLALAQEELYSQKLSHIKVFNLSSKFNLWMVFNPEKPIYKMWLYALSFSLIFLPFSDTLALHQAERRQRFNNLASLPNFEKIQTSPDSVLNGNGGTLSVSLPVPQNRKHEELLFTPVVQKQANQAKLVNTSTNPKPMSKDQVEQEGKLWLINDTPYIGIILLYKPGQKHPYRYAHIPPCSERKLSATYSNLWQVSFNNQTVSTIWEVSEKNSGYFKIKTSKLNEKNSIGNNCQYNSNT